MDNSREFPSRSLQPESPKLADDAFLALRDLIAEASGITFDEGSRFILERRLLPRLHALRFSSFESYYRFVLDGPDATREMDHLLEHVAIRETYFFREPHQFEAFREALLPRLARENGSSRRLRIWSAGCASGEEPFTVAMLVLDSRLFDGWDIEIVGTDLSATAIGEARRGVFRGGSMRIIPDDFKARFFARDGDDSWRIDDRVRDAVEFKRLNLVDTRGYERFSGVDVVYCRNLLIYFGANARRLVIDGFHAALRDDGYLLLGHAESLAARQTPFKLLHLQREIIYQK
jgi:chemotaxis protein methyltransferase CheR